MLRGGVAGGHQESCRNRRAAYSEIELEAVNRMDRAGPFGLSECCLAREASPRGSPHESMELLCPSDTCCRGSVAPELGTWNFVL